MIIMIMDMDRIGRALLLLLILGPCMTASVAAQLSAGAWTRNPDIVVIGEQHDPRQMLVREAVEYWNATLTALGSGFRLGRVEVMQADIPGDYLVAASRGLLARPRAVPPPPGVLSGVPGDLIVVLSDRNFISFGGLPLRNGKRVVAIKGMHHYPMSLPNVPLNILVHEFGHALGLGHHADPAGLMCGRPASCEPQLFQSGDRRIFPLLDGDKTALLRLYPADWKPQ